MTVALLQVTDKRYIPSEYLELEEQSEYKSEYRNGEIVPMGFAPPDRNRISLNVCFFLMSVLKGQNDE